MVVPGRNYRNPNPNPDSASSADDRAGWEGFRWEGRFLFPNPILWRRDHSTDQDEFHDPRPVPPTKKCRPISPTSLKQPMICLIPGQTAYEMSYCKLDKVQSTLGVQSPVTSQTSLLTGLCVRACVKKPIGN